MELQTQNKKLNSSVGLCLIRNARHQVARPSLQAMIPSSQLAEIARQTRRTINSKVKRVIQTGK